MVIADILKRWQVLKGSKNAQLLTGTDEHGLKVGAASRLVMSLWVFGC